MKSRGFVHHADTCGDVESVVELIDDVDRWSAWSRPMLVQTTWTHWGNSAPGGVGAVRRLGLWPVFIRELITGYERGVYQEYTVLTPRLFTTYVGRISLEARPAGGTLITWSVEFTPRWSVSGPLATFVLSRTIKRLSRNLAHAADVRSLAHGSSR
jgi:hypothetical protein